jgi:protein-S-isoprenylcysteine O-methyltransferase Ste14
MNLVAVIEVVIVVAIFFNMPFSPQGVPWNDDFTWSLFNYTPVVTGGLAIAIGAWWVLSARKWFKGPRHTIDELDAELGAPHTAAPAPAEA